MAAGARRRWLVWGLLAASCAAPAPHLAPERASSSEVLPALGPERLGRMRAYIRATWETLTRSERDLPRAAVDPKAAHAPGAPWPVYVAVTEDRGRGGS